MAVKLLLNFGTVVVIPKFRCGREITTKLRNGREVAYSEVPKFAME